MLLCRRAVFLSVLLLLSACSEEPVEQPRWLDARSALSALDQGELSSETLVTYYLDNIARDNRQGHELAAIIDINADALAQARAWSGQRVTSDPHCMACRWS